MALRLIIHVLAVVALLVASVVAMADQSDKLIGAHEIPPFVRERVDLPPRGGQPIVAHGEAG